MRLILTSPISRRLQSRQMERKKQCATNNNLPHISRLPTPHQTYQTMNRIRRSPTARAFHRTTSSLCVSATVKMGVSSRLGRVARQCRCGTLIVVRRQVATFGAQRMVIRSTSVKSEIVAQTRAPEPPRDDRDIGLGLMVVDALVVHNPTFRDQGSTFG